jgi:YggT family protein
MTAVLAATHVVALAPALPAARHLVAAIPAAGPAAAGPAAALPIATARVQIAQYLSTLIYVYTLLILAHIVLNWLFAFGLRPPYSRAGSAVIGFLRDVCEPFLRIFRRILPSFGAFDFSPIVAIIVLGIVDRVVVEGLIRG